MILLRILFFMLFTILMVNMHEGLQAKDLELVLFSFILGGVAFGAFYYLPELLTLNQD